MLYERIKELCKKRGTSIAEMERALGFGRSSISSPVIRIKYGNPDKYRVPSFMP